VQGFERSQFPQRSGDIIVLPETIQDDSFLYLVDSNSFETPKEGLTIEETNIANLISTLIGGPIVNSAVTLKETIIPSAHNLFNKARANLVVFVNSLGSDDLASLPSLKLFQQRGQKIGIERVAYPQDTIASLTTFITGHTPSTHGIVHQQWEGNNGQKLAYSSDASSRIFNVNDQITQVFEGQPLIISASLDFQMASTLAVNVNNRIGNNFAFYWDEKSAGFESVFNGRTEGLNFTESKLLEKLEKNDQIKALFDLKNKEELYFLAELEFLQNMVQQFGLNERFSELIQDNIPDLFSFSFASLKTLKKRGDASKYAAAVQLLDETLLKVFNELSTIYGGKISLEVVFLGTPAFEKISQDTKLKDQLFALLKDKVNKDTFDKYFPSIYLIKSGNQEVCQRVREEIPNEIICTNHRSYVPSVKEMVRLVTEASVGDTLDDAVVFQTVLWMSIIVALFAFGAVWAMCQMQLPADSILYRTSAPKQHTS